MVCKLLTCFMNPQIIQAAAANDQVRSRNIVQREPVTVTRTTVAQSCPEQKYVISNFSSLKGSCGSSNSLNLGFFKVEGEIWYFYLRPSDDAFPEIYLTCLGNSGPLRVKFAITIVNQENPNNSVLLGHEDDHVRTFERYSRGWGWKTPIKTNPIPSGLIVKDTLVLRTSVTVLKDTLIPAPIKAPSLTNLQDALQLRGREDIHPDIMLKLGDDMLPGQRYLLSASSNYFKTMFQSGMSESRSNVVEIKEIATDDMRITLKFIDGKLQNGDIPEDRMQLLVLATHRLQMDVLMDYCVMELTKQLTLDNFAEIALLGDRVDHQGLQEACVKFALQEESRLALLAGEQEALGHIMKDAPILALRLVEELLKPSVQKDERNVSVQQ